MTANASVISAGSDHITSVSDRCDSLVLSGTALEQGRFHEGVSQHLDRICDNYVERNMTRRGVVDRLLKCGFLPEMEIFEQKVYQYRLVHADQRYIDITATMYVYALKQY